MDTIKQLIDQYGPAIVAAAQRQVQVAIWQDVAWAIFGAILLVFAAKVARYEVRYWTDPEKSAYDDREDRNMVLAIAGGLAGILGFILFVSSVGEVWTFTSNPDWAVIKMVRTLLPK